ncbi:MAG: hypothetical protein JW993_16190 [Sedimentisphaerales bacterium]|nr:hypothetical protein [Sedimentisphaerales bacterium]
MRDKRILRRWWVWLVLFTGVLVGLVMGGGGASDRGLPTGARQMLDAPGSEKGAVFRDLTYDYRVTDGAFALREQMYFLLTPALLVQEAVSDNVVLTYPQE